MTDVANIAVCVGTFGDRSQWEPLVHQRALASVDRQTMQPCRFAHHHANSLHDARNSAARGSERHLVADAEWLCFLDADDELDDGYIAAMHTAARDLEGDWLLQPATLGVHPDGREEPPALIPPKHLLDGNYLVISTLIRRNQFDRLGGFADWPIYEDWDLWLRAWLDGAQTMPVPDAVLRIHVNPNGRNMASRALQTKVYNEIRSRYA